MRLSFRRRAKPPEIRIEAQRKDNLWQFSILDNGIGIDSCFGDKVFAIFQRLHRRDEYPGTGIGLSTCKKFIELLGGLIWFESTPGQGTVFFFTVPDQASHL